MVYGCDDPGASGGGCTGGRAGTALLYAGGHCHAPSCLGLELFDAASGALLCRQTPLYGGGDLADKFDEAGYATIPPCLWRGGGGGDDAALPAAPFLPFNATLRTVAVQNATYGHYGQMASWQMRGVLTDAPL